MAITQINPYINFAGDAAEAIEHYKQHLGAEVVSVMRWRDMPGGDCPPGAEDRVMHACLRVGDQQFMLSDVPPGRALTREGASVVVNVEDLETTERCFKGLAEGGEVTMALHSTFWGATFGMLNDRFGVSWMFNCDEQRG